MIERTESETKETLGEEKIVTSHGRSSFMPGFSSNALDLKQSDVTKSSPPSHTHSLRANKAQLAARYLRAVLGGDFFMEGDQSQEVFDSQTAAVM